MTSDDDLNNVIPLFRQATPQDGMERGIAELWQATFLHRGLSLADPETVEAMEATTELMDVFVRGLCAVDTITEEQREAIRYWLGSGRFAVETFES